ncbi:hypothetical protein [Alistipes finegoldii]|uniref:hypothetical protein n=1 Tax=Alistipes finegoldii TaxID=214856 RepID=UPI002665C53A|nr:hypothetical protein [Alistipes finegoldii]
MGKLKILTALLLAAALTACGDDSDVFYTTSYPVARIEVSVSLSEPENPDPENPDPENPDAGTSQTEEPENPENPENPLLEEIWNDALAKAPVQAGGGYRLDFTHHNGGPLVVRPAADAETVTGTFIKEPDKPEELHFTFGEQAYTCKVSGYTDTDDLRKTLFSVDLTEEYKQLYPDAGITQVIRKEYTSHPY